MTKLTRKVSAKLTGALKIRRGSGRHFTAFKPDGICFLNYFKRSQRNLNLYGVLLVLLLLYEV